jgi:hypothetical protein
VGGAADAFTHLPGWPQTQDFPATKPLFDSFPGNPAVRRGLGLDVLAVVAPDVVLVRLPNVVLNSIGRHDECSVSVFVSHLELRERSGTRVDGCQYFAERMPRRVLLKA